MHFMIYELHIDIFTNSYIRTDFIVSSQLIDHLLAGIEDVVGYWGQHYWKDKFVSCVLLTVNVLHLPLLNMILKT